MIHPAGEVKRYTSVTAVGIPNGHRGRPGRAEQGTKFRRPGHLRRSRLVHLSWLACFLSLPHLRHRLGAGILAACLSNCLSTCLSICLAGFITLCALTLSATPASADVNSELNRFWNNLGATSTFTDDMTRQLQDWYAGELPVKVAGRACHQPGPATSPPLRFALGGGKDPGQHPGRRLWFIIDELPTLERIPSLTSGQRESRRFGGGCFEIGTQVVSELREIYGRYKAETISGNCDARLIRWAVRRMPLHRQERKENAMSGCRCRLSDRIGSTTSRPFRQKNRFRPRASRSWREPPSLRSRLGRPACC